MKSIREHVRIFILIFQLYLAAGALFCLRLAGAFRPADRLRRIPAGAKDATIWAGITTAAVGLAYSVVTMELDAVVAIWIFIMLSFAAGYFFSAVNARQGWTRADEAEQSAAMSAANMRDLQRMDEAGL